MTKRKLEGLTKDQLDEEIATQASLTSFSKNAKGNDAAAHAVEVLMKLAPSERAKHISDLERSLRSHKSGDGVEDGTDVKSRASLKDHPSKNKNSLAHLKKKMTVRMKDFFPEVSEQMREQFATMFVESIDRISTSRSAAQALADLFESNPHFSLLWKPESYLEQVEIWSQRVEQLEQACLEVEEENQMIREQMMRNEIGRHLEEEALYSPPSQRRRSMHNIADDLEAVDEDNRYLLGETSYHAGDARMNARRAYLEQTTAHTDISNAKNYLVETWELAKN